MILKALKDSDRLILSVTAAVMVLFAWAYYNFPERPSYLPPGKPVGRLDSLGTIRRFNKNKKVWEEVKDPNLYAGDALASSENTVRILFPDGSSADLEPNSILRLGKDKTGSPLLTLLQGSAEPMGRVAVRFRSGDVVKAKQPATLLAHPAILPLPSDYR